MYSILLIETGEYLYRIKERGLGHDFDIYSKEEVLDYYSPHIFKPVEVDTITEAEQILSRSCRIKLNGEFITPTEHSILFEIVEI